MIDQTVTKVEKRLSAQMLAASSASAQMLQSIMDLLLKVEKPDEGAKKVDYASYVTFFTETKPRKLAAIVPGTTFPINTPGDMNAFAAALEDDDDGLLTTELVSFVESFNFFNFSNFMFSSV
jgi:hypothetical protein